MCARGVSELGVPDAALAPVLLVAAPGMHPPSSSAACTRPELKGVTWYSAGAVGALLALPVALLLAALLLLLLLLLLAPSSARTATLLLLPQLLPAAWRWLGCCGRAGGGAARCCSLLLLGAVRQGGARGAAPGRPLRPCISAPL